MSNELAVPRPWRQAVIAALRSHDDERVRVTLAAQQDWAHTFPAAWPSQLAETLADALQDDQLTGRQVQTMREIGETWEFMFHHERRLLYSKINLRPDGRVVIVYSVHAPRKGVRL
jgi:hypothetical protein